MLKWCCEGGSDLPVITSVEGAVGDSEKSSSLGVVSVFTVALEEGKGRQKVTFLQEVVRIWQLELLLLLEVANEDRVNQMCQRAGW